MPTTTRRGSRNVPQPTAVPKPADEPTGLKAPSPEEVAWNALVERASSGDDPAARQIRRALELERERAEVIRKVDANRRYLRLMDTNEELDEDQTEFLDTFYPDKSRGSHRTDDDYAATRRAREAARKGGSGS